MLRFLFLWGIGGARSSGGEAKVLCGVCSTLYGSTSGGKERERKEGACTAARSARGAVIEEDKWNILGVRVTSAYVCRTESSRRAGGGRRCAPNRRCGDRCSRRRAFGKKEKGTVDRAAAEDRTARLEKSKKDSDGGWL